MQHLEKNEIALKLYIFDIDQLYLSRKFFLSLFKQKDNNAKL